MNHAKSLIVEALLMNQEVCDCCQKLVETEKSRSLEGMPDHHALCPDCAPIYSAWWPTDGGAADWRSFTTRQKRSYYLHWRKQRRTELHNAAAIA
jgi:hypothetical protein